MNLKDYLFKTKDDKYVYTQIPNPPIIIAFIFLALGAFVGSLDVIFHILFLIFLAVWALSEIFYGVNRFRIILGILVLLFVFFRFLF